MADGASINLLQSISSPQVNGIHGQEETTVNHSVDLHDQDDSFSLERTDVGARERGRGARERGERERLGVDTLSTPRWRKVWRIMRHLAASLWLKMTLFVSILVLLASGVLALVLWLRCNSELRQAIQLRLTTVSALRAQQVLDYINGERDKGDLVSSRLIIQNLLAKYQTTGILNSSEIIAGRGDLLAAIGSLPEFESAWALDINGRVLFSTDSEVTPPNLNENLKNVLSANRTVFSEPYQTDNMGVEADITCPVVFNGSRVGHVLAIINATFFEQVLQSNLGLDSTGEIVMAYRVQSTGVYRFLLEPRLGTNTSNGSTPDQGGAVARAVKNETGFAVTKDFRGVRVAAAFIPVGYRDWGLSAQEDVAEAYRPVNDLQTVIIIAIVCVLLVGLLASWALARLFTDPIVELGKIAGALARGDMDARGNRRHRLWEDEIDSLRHTFNSMADQLSVAYITLEAKVIERTRALARANDVLASEVQERKKIEADLEVARNAAVAADRMKSEWLANMSHEIRTPLNGVINCTELCLDTATTPEQQEYLELSLFSAKHLLRLITDILDFSKIEAGKLDMESIEFSLLDQMEHAISVLAARAHKKGIELVCRTSDAIPEVLVGDPGRLFQIFINLIGNSIKFTEKGQVVLAATSRGMVENGILELLFSVTDTGIGIPKSKQSLLFQAFSQVEASTTRVYGGTGLGLVISSKLANAMGGRMWVDSDEGVGSTFSFTARLLLPPGQPSPKGIMVPSAMASLRNVRTLVVDASATSRSIVRNLLERWGLNVEEAENGKESIAKMEIAADLGQPFQLMLLDLHVPMDRPGSLGCTEILRLLQQRPQLLTRTRSNPTSAKKNKVIPDDGTGLEMVDLPPSEVELELPVKFRDMGNIGQALAKTQAQAKGGGTSEAERRVGNNRNTVRSEGSTIPPPPPWPSLEQEKSPGKWGGWDMESQKEEDDLRPLVRTKSYGPTGLRMEPGWSLPVLLLMSSLAADVSKSTELGVEVFLQKPIKRLLLLKAIRHALQLGDGPEQMQNVSSIPSVADKCRKLHILVAEDNVINQRVALTLLHKWGHSTVLASTGAEAVEKHKLEKFDLILMDVQMPVMDGLEATEKIRELENEEGRRTPIVAMTAHAMMGDGQKCLRSGMTAYIPKPLNSSKLQDLLRLVAEKGLP